MHDDRCAALSQTSSTPAPQYLPSTEAGVRGRMLQARGVARPASWNAPADVAFRVILALQSGLRLFEQSVICVVTVRRSDLPDRQPDHRRVAVLPE